MLWTLLKIVLFVAVIVAITFGVERLVEAGDGLRIAVAGIELNLGPLQSVLLVLLLVGAVWLLFKAVALFVATLRFLNGDETAMSRYFGRNRQRRGYEAVTDGLIALASGDAAKAQQKVQKAEKLLGASPMTSLLGAQAAELGGDHAAALTRYKALIAEPRTKFAGVRGALRQKLAIGDKTLALRLAEKGFGLDPANAEVQQTLLQLQAEHREWAGARRTLQARRDSGALPKDVYRRRDAVLALQQADDLREKGEAGRAKDLAIEANDASPGLVPAAVAAARAHTARENPRKAVKALKRAWAENPHPELAVAFAEIAPNETPAERVKRFAPLLAIAPDDPETRMLEAELLIAAEDFPGARRALRDLPERAPTARALTIMAAVERGEGSSDAVVRGWLTKAVTAPRGPQWICDNCQTVHPRWVAICDNCGSFDTLSWRAASHSESLSPTGTEMLPLVVGDGRADAASSADPAAEPADGAGSDDAKAAEAGRP
mgnify:CR=1 FL=1